MAVVACPNPTNFGATVETFPHGAIAITPNDTDTFAVPVIVYRIVTGNLAVTPANGGADVAFTDWPANVPVPFKCRRVLETGTAAGVVIGVY